MDVEFRIESNHLRRDDPGLDAAIQKYTSKLWPFGRKEKALKKLTEKQEEILTEHAIEKDAQLNYTVLEVKDVKSEEEAWDRIEAFKEDLHQFYRDELGFDAPPMEITISS